jgi:hypothetical protein
LATAKKAPADTQAIASPLARIAAEVKRRAIPGTGFEERGGGGFRPDATAWAILALATARGYEDIVEDARDALETRQGEDGRLALSPEHTEVFWPTAPAILAWHQSLRHREARDRGVRFLLSVSGVKIERKLASPFAHDTTLRGWPWTGSGFSWVEPTSLALIALGAVGERGHQRVDEAVRMLLDRQLEGGGWNYGNTVVFDRVLSPMAAPTGMALQALAGSVEEKDVAASLTRLESILPGLRTPFSLSWAILGLGAWGRRPVRAEKLAGESLALQARYGSYGTTDLSLLLLAHMSTEGLSFPS